MHQAGISVRRPHFVGFGGVHTDRFFAEQMFTSIGTSHHGLVMQRVRRGDDDEVDVRVLYHLAPVAGQQLRAVLLACPLEQFAAAGAQRDNVCSGSLADLRTVRGADVAGGPDHADVELKFSRMGFVVRIHAAVDSVGPKRVQSKTGGAASR